MGCNRLISKDKSKVERTSLSKTFEEMCPIFMSYGMTYDEFWYKSPYRAKFYKDAHILKVRQTDEEMWIQGMYIYEALCDASPLFRFSMKKGTVKPEPYAKEPYPITAAEVRAREEREARQKEEKLKAEFALFAEQLRKKMP